MDIIENYYQDNKEGFLEIVLGSMYSGKTSRLIETYYKCLSCNIPCIIVNHSDDTRYHNTMLSNHNKVMISCLQYNLLNEFIINETSKLVPGTIILINEAQFFPDLFNSIIHLTEKQFFRVALYGLDGDFERKPFGDILNLIPYCNNVIKLHAYCYDCKNGKKGIFSKRITEEKDQKLVGSSNYKPLCRKCFLKST